LSSIFASCIRVFLFEMATFYFAIVGSRDNPLYELESSQLASKVKYIACEHNKLTLNRSTYYVYVRKFTYKFLHHIRDVQMHISICVQLLKLDKLFGKETYIYDK
jgi:hypothetical protein